MGDYRDEREAALQRAEVLAQHNAQLQGELDALRQGRGTPGTTRAPRWLLVLLAFTVVAGSGAAFLAAAMVRRPGGSVQRSSLELRGRWSPPAPVAPVALRGAVRAGGGTWVVGDRGTVLFRAESAAAWTPVPSGTDADLHAILSSDPLLVVGARGTALRFDPAQRRWVAEDTGTREHLYAVAGGLYGRRIAVGARGVVVVRSADTGAWSPLASGVTTDLYGIALSTPDNGIIVVGAGGTILGAPADGGAFTRQASPVTATLRAVAAWNNTLLAVGDGGVMVSTSALSPWTVVPSGTTEDLFVVAATEIPYDEQRPGYGSSGSTFGFLAAGARGSVLVDRLGSVEGWRPVRAGGGAIRALTPEPWSFFTDQGAVIGFSPR